MTAAMRELVVHRTPVHLPARSVAWRAGLRSAADRRCLSGLRPHRLEVGPVIVARRALAARPAPQPTADLPPDLEPGEWLMRLASLALIAAPVLWVVLRCL